MNELTIIAERINYSSPRIERLLKSFDFVGIQNIAREQAEEGANYIDINIGPLPAEYMESTIEAVQEVVNLPLCFDSDDITKLEAGLYAYDSNKSDGIPILNSATESRIEEVLALRQIKECQVILLVSERLVGTSKYSNLTVKEICETAKRLFYRAVDRSFGFKPYQIYIDPGMSPIGGDVTGLVNLTLDAIAEIRNHIEDVHILVGLSNLTHSLPKEVRLFIENAFLTLAIPKGLDTIIGNPSKKYQILDKENYYVQGIIEILNTQGLDRLKILQGLYLESY